MKLIKRILFLGFISIILQSCSLYEGPFACTDEFVMHSVTVLDQTGEPADSVQIKVTNSESGKVYEVCEESRCDGIDIGIYLIMHDGFLGKISEEREQVSVEGTKGELAFKEEYVFRSGKCHVEKFAGPDTVSLASN